MVKPRIIWTGVQWMCYVRNVLTGGPMHIVGFGESPDAAYYDWRGNMGYRDDE